MTYLQSLTHSDLYVIIAVIEPNTPAFFILRAAHLLSLSYSSHIHPHCEPSSFPFPCCRRQPNSCPRSLLLEISIGSPLIPPAPFLETQGPFHQICDGIFMTSVSLCQYLMWSSSPPPNRHISHVTRHLAMNEQAMSTPNACASCASHQKNHRIRGIIKTPRS